MLSPLGRVQKVNLLYWKVSSQLPLSDKLQLPTRLLRADTPFAHAELGVNFDHILQKSLTVLNPLGSIDQHIMDDADLAGPLVFCSVFASFLLLVSSSTYPLPSSSLVFGRQGFCSRAGNLASLHHRRQSRSRARLSAEPACVTTYLAH